MDVLKALVILSLAGLTARDSALFSSSSVLDLTLKAPLQEVFQQRAENDKFAATGVLSYRDPATGADVVINGVELSVRGHTSRRGSECPFPKLKVAFGKKDASRDASIFDDLQGLRIGTHCGESEGEQLTPEFGRLANEKSPLREAFVYRLLGAMGVPTLRARPARIAYVDTTGGEQQPVLRNAVLLEDDDDARRRIGATGEITMEQFTTARELFAPADTARLAFAQAMIGNFDWCLRLYPDDTYRCDAKQPLWNMSAFKRADGPALPVIADFDLAGMVVGSHNWFNQVYYAGFVPSHSSIEVEVLSQVQRTRSLFSRAQLDDMRRYFLSRRSAAYDAVAQSPLDSRGRELAVQHLDAFFADLADAAFYRPVIARPGTAVYVDAGKSREACAAGDVAPPGTPVDVIGSQGEMAQVALLDVHWQWAPPGQCAAVRNGPVWIEKTAISADYPAQGLQRQ
jgi:hypothetical protein